MNIVFVAERNGKPILNGDISVEAVPNRKTAEARMEVTSFPRLETERMVPYVSVEALQELLRTANPLEMAGALMSGLEDLLKGLQPIPNHTLKISQIQSAKSVLPNAVVFHFTANAPEEALIEDDYKSGWYWASEFRHDDPFEFAMNNEPLASLKDALTAADLFDPTP